MESGSHKGQKDKAPEKGCVMTLERYNLFYNRSGDGQAIFESKMKILYILQVALCAIFVSIADMAWFFCFAHAEERQLEVLTNFFSMSQSQHMCSSHMYIIKVTSVGKHIVHIVP